MTTNTIAHASNGIDVSALLADGVRAVWTTARDDMKHAVIVAHPDPQSFTLERGARLLRGRARRKGMSRCCATSTRWISIRG